MHGTIALNRYDLIAQIERRALEIAAVFEAKDGKFWAEKLDDEPKWHLVRTAPGRENKAADFLEARRFGVFLPKFAKGSMLRIGNDTVNMSDKLIFPGRVLLFTWNILSHWRRIKACPGVVSIAVHDNEDPVVIPDAEVTRIQILQYILALPKGPKKRKRKRYGVVLNDDDGAVQLTLSTNSYWSVDGTERNRLLEGSLGLAS